VRVWRCACAGKDAAIAYAAPADRYCYAITYDYAAAITLLPPLLPPLIFATLITLSLRRG